MADQTAGRLLDRAAPARGRLSRPVWVMAAGLLASLLACLVMLEGRLTGLDVAEIAVGETPVTVYQRQGGAPAPAVIVAHGFGGSRQMMDQIAVSVARQGFVVASVDLPGHGRNGVPLSPEVAEIEGTTAQLVAVVEEVAEAVAAWPDTVGPVSYIGHSMATDVVIRAAGVRDDVGAVVAISMYSPAVTAMDPAALLVLSGATEGHLRQAGLEAARLVDTAAAEGATVSGDGVQRRVAVAPYVGHVGVLYAPLSLAEVTGWLRDVTGVAEAAPLDRTGWIAGITLAALVLLMWPLSRLLTERDKVGAALVEAHVFWVSVLAPVPVVLVVALLPVFGIAGFAAFGTLAALLAVWGWVQLVVLVRAGCRMALPDWVGACVYLGLSLIFALALDRYGAAFVPGGERVWVMAGLLLGTLPVMVADTLLVQGASLVRRVVARVVLLIALSVAMALSPTELGLTFTVLPVLALYFVVYGTIARWVAARRGPDAVALGKGVVLAWAIAATTPLFAA